jgi:hypothetical protein
VATTSADGAAVVVGRRQQHRSDRVDGDALRSRAAGRQGEVSSFQNETHHYFVGVVRSGDSAVVRVEMSDGARVKDSVLASVARFAARRHGLSQDRRAAADTISISLAAPASGSRCY